MLSNKMIARAGTSGVTKNLGLAASAVAVACCLSTLQFLSVFNGRFALLLFHADFFQRP